MLALRSCREAQEKGLPVPPEPDFKITIPRQPHWTIVRIQRRLHSLLQLVSEGIAQHRVVSIMGIKPSAAKSGFGLFGVDASESDSRDSDPSDVASQRCALLESCVNGVTEGFLC